MSVYFNKDKEWWMYFFRHNKKAYTGGGFKRKKDALEAEAERKKEVKKPKMVPMEETDMDFLTLVNNRLDFLEAYRSAKHYRDTLYMAKRWVRQWKDKTVHEITPAMVMQYLIDLKNRISAHTANKELRGLKALFNFGIKPPNRWFLYNPTDGVQFFPTESREKYVPPVEDVIKVLLAAEGQVQDYLWTIALTMGRVSEVNRLRWNDVDFNNRKVTLYTRKTRGGHLKPRKIPMTNKLREVLERRLKGNNTPWVFHHTYYSWKTGEWVTGPYGERKRIMEGLCRKAGVRYFRFHPIRHFGASILEKEGVPFKTIQELLGHENRRTTEIYLHSFSDSDKNAMDCLETTLNRLETNVIDFESAIPKRNTGR